MNIAAIIVSLFLVWLIFKIAKLAFRFFWELLGVFAFMAVIFVIGHVLLGI